VRIVDAFYKVGETIRGFFTAGLGPRAQDTGDALGGKTFYAGTAEVRFPLPFVPDDLGFGGAVFADAGSVYGTDAQKFAYAYATKHNVANTLVVEDSDTLRTSVGASLLWNSPVGPLRADFAYVLNKAAFDQTQVFRFGAATKF
jgi:outer membrane protein insertion porin family